ncbi:LON peptidase substrate-binding domain-containing protein [Pelagibaculum spongiae]|uniref:Peptidase S16 n=1 Tax=Pelagibaculum spongiae TaxID=2080658 RepID=A0A2V1GX16_9GAMM|nr:LON peptidase substrate-binding domain-containing protein [Pelagibaculum spongiae]PVZ65467.1 peptidase S16 [Pelagibaculum spongiae]
MAQQKPDQKQSKDKTQVLDMPLFPLRSILFPGGQLELQVFEPRYLSLVSECLREDREFGVVFIDSGEETGAPASVHQIGCSARIFNWDSLPNGFLGISVVGGRRFKIIKNWARKEDLQIRADVEWIEAPKMPIPEGFEGLTELLQQALLQKNMEIPQECDDACWMVFRVAEVLPLSDDQKQSLLNEEDPRTQLQQLTDILEKTFN